ncbi:hypothetical protein ACFYPN_32560 [Streptomyces sp. NPDC005576]|uniref:hypothetical protein n=1 Tax=Streptomyces sp. NPDC005576 TaxID=3364726 RepID=UPI0036772131
MTLVIQDGSTAVEPVVPSLVVLMLVARVFLDRSCFRAVGAGRHSKCLGATSR